MSNKTQLSTNNTQLASLIQTLQGKAAGGGSGGSVETCEVSVTNCYYVFYTGVENGNLVAKMSSGTSTSSDHAFTACRNSAILCGRPIGSVVTGTFSGAVSLGSYDSYYCALELTDSTAVIRFSSGSAGGSG